MPLVQTSSNTLLTDTCMLNKRVIYGMFLSVKGTLKSLHLDHKCELALF